MSRWLLAMAGCSGEPGVPTGPLVVAVDALPAEEHAATLEVTVAEVVFDAAGPSGRESVAVIVGYTFQPLEVTDAVVLELELGTHTEGVLTIEIRADDGPGLVYRGSTEDGGVIRIEVEAAELSFSIPRVEISETPRSGRVTFRPARWLPELDDDDASVVIGPSSPRYDALLGGIAASTTFAFDDGAGGNGGDDGGDD